MADQMSHTLYSLMLATVMFIAIFAIVKGYSFAGAPLTETYQAIGSTGNLNPTNITGFNVYNNTVGNFSVSPVPAVGSETVKNMHSEMLGTQDIRFGWLTATGYPDIFTMVHYISLYYGLSFRWDYLKEASGEVDSVPASLLTIGQGGTFYGVSRDWIMNRLLVSNPSNLNSTTINFKGDTITVQVTMTAENTNHTLYYALQNSEAVHILYQYQLDFSAMGTNIWSVISGMFTFTTFDTGSVAVDLLFNGIIGLTCWISLIYIAYRLVTGILPFASGGGGQ